MADERRESLYLVIIGIFETEIILTYCEIVWLSVFFFSEFSSRECRKGKTA